MEEKNQSSGMYQEADNQTSGSYRATGYEKDVWEENKQKKDGNAIASLVCGILSIACCMPAGIVGLILAITCQGKISPDKESVRIAGLVTSIIGLVIQIGAIILRMVGWLGVGFLTLFS